MSDSNNTAASFGKFVPGFDFLQGLATQAVKGATSGLPNIPQMPNPANWVAPTLNVEELDKRIEELKTVQFWLDQNAKALQATITALEVQKMTLATLKGMNFNMGDVANAFKLKAADTMANVVTTWKDPHDHVFEIYNHTHKSGMESGDFENALLGQSWSYEHEFLLGCALAQLDVICSRLVGKLNLHKVNSVKVMTIQQWLVVLHLRVLPRRRH